MNILLTYETHGAVEKRIELMLARRRHRLEMTNLQT